jgi:hypothetical protein
MENLKKPPTMRELMPDGFTRTLGQETGFDRTVISNLVNLEQHTRRGWPAVVALAEKTNPDGYAQWAAAYPDKLPKVAA